MANSTFKYSGYTNKYKDILNNLNAQRASIQSSYDPYLDADFVAASKDLERRQKYAAEDARAKMNAAVGGTGSGTATATAMAQVNNDYIKRINDLIPVYRQKALSDIDDQITAYTQAESEDYDRYKDSRDFAYKNYVSNRDYNYKKKKEARDYALQIKNYKLKKAAQKTSTDSKQYKNAVASATLYAKQLWSRSSSSAVKQTFNYITSLGLSKKETLSMISKLPNRNGKKALALYTKYSSK